MNLLSGDSKYVGLNEYSHVIAIPVIFLSMILGIQYYEKRISWFNILKPRVRQFLICLSFFFLLFWNNRSPMQFVHHKWPDSDDKKLFNEIEKLKFLAKNNEDVLIFVDDLIGAYTPEFKIKLISRERSLRGYSGQDYIVAFCCKKKRRAGTLTGGNESKKTIILDMENLRELEGFKEIFVLQNLTPY